MGTLVELGVLVPPAHRGDPTPWAEQVLESGWQAIAAVERTLSAFRPGSDVSRFNSAPAGARLPVGPEAAAVLGTARRLWRASSGIFDVTLGTGPCDWALSRQGGVALLRKGTGAVRLDLGGIAKGFGVDRALAAMVASAARAGRRPGCWVNAGGDLRTRGAPLEVRLRDERAGGARPWLTLRGGAVATSDFTPGARSSLAGGASRARHVSVLSPRCLWSDALTKVVAASGRTDHPLLEALGARAFVHDADTRQGEC
jgi:FAD:protein FMN transferase